ncbi:MAG TPA: DUF4403 family protein [Longimicrobiaceae bacterium]|jgi:hypothetical protein
MRDPTPPSPPAASGSPARLRLRPYAAAGLALALAACGTRVDVPAPDTAAAAVPFPEPPPSVVHLPVSVELGAVVRKVEGAVPRTQSREDEWHPMGKVPVLGTLYVKEMWERDPLEVGLDGDGVRVSTRVRYRARIAEQTCLPRLGCRWVQLAWCGHEGPMPSLRVGLRTDLRWRRDWTVEPSTTASPVEAGAPCRLTRANVDVSDRVRSAVQGLLDGAVPQVDAELRRALVLRPQVEDVWDRLQEPIPAGKGVFLLFRPEAVALAEPTARGTRMRTSLSVTVRPRVVLGERPETRPTPLPDYARTAPRAGGFRVNLVAELPYEAANRMLADELVGKEVELRGHRVQVRGVELYPGGGRRLALRVRVGGDARGTLYFVGTPLYNPNSQTVVVPDLDFSVESRNVLGRSADWLLHDELRDRIRGAAHFAVGDRVAEIRDKVNTAMNRDLGRAVKLSGHVESLRPVGVFVTRTALATLVEADGSARVDITIR